MLEKERGKWSVMLEESIGGVMEMVITSQRIEGKEARGADG